MALGERRPTRPAGDNASAGGGGRLARTGHKADGDQWRGAVRLTVEQCAILQGFPPDLPWPKPASLAHTMIGNAVPPALAEAVARMIRDLLEGQHNSRS